jgi:diaminopimelate epimerase
VTDIRFTKVHGMGNDFLIIEREDIAVLENASSLAREMCDRNYGAGADGIIFVARSTNDEADFASRIFNADGSEAGVSGNGTRCVAAFVYHVNLWDKSEIRIDTAAGIKLGRLVFRHDARFEFEFDMGTPILSSDRVPMSISPALERVTRYPIEIGEQLVEATCLSMGNPQCVIFVSDLASVNLEELGPRIERHPIFPDRVNVEFAQVISRDEIEIRIWERGAGHTLSSGTGSCASAVASSMNGFTDRKVGVRTEGGTLMVDWSDENRVLLTASAAVVYEGRWLAEARR